MGLLIPTQLPIAHQCHKRPRPNHHQGSLKSQAPKQKTATGLSCAWPLLPSSQRERVWLLQPGIEQSATGNHTHVHLTPWKALGLDERGGVEQQAPVTALNPLNKQSGRQKRRLGAGGVAPGEDAS